MKEPRNGSTIAAGSSLESKHKLHITGEGYKKQISQVEGFESSNDYNIKKQVAQPSTLQITSIILDNLNRWTSAQGTVKKIDFKDAELNKKFNDVLDQVWHGDSYEKFVNTFQREAIFTDFNGFALVTKPKIVDGVIEREGVIKPFDGDNVDPYLIFIANNDVHDFYLTGDKVEYLIIKTGDKTFRLIDDEKDVIFTWEKAREKVINRDEIVNELGYVPARKMTSINKNILDNQLKTSPIDHIIPALDRYFSADADLRMQFIRHNYPKLAIVTKDCTDCVDGKVPDPNDPSTTIKCKTCDGSGKVVPISRDGVIGLPQYLANGDSAYPGTPASYITPETESLRLGLEDLDAQKKAIIYSGTGDKNLIAESLNTATENVINSRSLEDRIREITQMVEEFETFIKTCIKKMHNDFKDKDWFISIRYGKRISTKGETELINEMESAKEAGMPISYISALHRDLIYAKYKNNKIELERQLLLADVEPLSGYNVNELDKIKDYTDKRDLYVKINFDSIVSEIEQETPLAYFMIGKTYPEKVKALNDKIDEIFQRRAGNNNPDGGQGMGTAQENRA